MPLKTREVGKTGVEAELRRVAKEGGWFAPKFTSPANRGVPDRICFKGLEGAVGYVQMLWPILDNDAAEQIVRDIVQHVVEFAECKAPGKTATPKQKMMHERLNALGLNTVIIDSKESAREYVRGD